MGIKIKVVNGGEGLPLDTDSGTSFSFSWDNPIFFTGTVNLSHTLDLSVPATATNCRIFDWSEIEAAAGMRAGKPCVVEFPGGEIDGRIYLKDYKGKRFNLMFVWGKELDDIYTLSIGSYWHPGNRLEMRPPKDFKEINHVDDFGFLWYRESEFSGSFASGISILPCANLGWMMSKVCNEAGKSLEIDGEPISTSMQVPDHVNPFRYFVQIPSTQILKKYEIVLTNWKAGLDATLFNYIVLDDLGGQVSLDAAGLDLAARQFQTNTAGAFDTLGGFVAVRETTIKLSANPAIVAVSGDMQVGTDYIVLYSDIEIHLNAGNFFTLLNIADFDTYTQLPKYFGSVPDSYIYYYRPDVEVDGNDAMQGSEIELSQNLPELSLLDLIANYCLITSSCYWINGNEINIVTSEYLKQLLRANVNILNLDDGKVFDVGSLYRYIDGFAAANTIEFDSADYVTDENRVLRAFGVNNDLIGGENNLGRIDFNGGNMLTDGTASFENFVTDGSGNVTSKAKIGIVYQNDVAGEFAYHLKWVERNYNVGSFMGNIIRNASSEVVRFRQPLLDVIGADIAQKVQWRGCTWMIKSLTWADGVTEALLVSVDTALREDIEVPPNE